MMTDDDFERIASDQPELRVRPEVRQQHLRLLADLVDSSPGRRRLIPKRAAIIAAGVVALSAGGMSVAAAFNAFSTPTNRNVAHCYATADLGDSTNHTNFAIATPVDPTVTVALGDAASEALDTCAGDWSQGRFSSTDPKVRVPDTSGKKYPVPPLTACVLESGEVGVFPGTNDICQRLGLTIADLK